jgi:cytochrome c556
MRSSRIAALSLALVLGVSACSSSSTPAAPTAEQQVCDARAALSTSFQKVVDDIAALNLGQAKADFATVKTDVAALLTATQGLAAEKKAAIEPQVAAIQESVAALASVASIEELTAGIEAVTTQVGGVVQTLAATAQCT